LACPFLAVLADGKMTGELYDRTAPLPARRNLADDPAFAATVKEMQTALEAWLANGGNGDKQESAIR